MRRGQRASSSSSALSCLDWSCQFSEKILRESKSALQCRARFLIPSAFSHGTHSPFQIIVSSVSPGVHNFWVRSRELCAAPCPGHGSQGMHSIPERMRGPCTSQNPGPDLPELNETCFSPWGLWCTRRTPQTRGSRLRLVSLPTPRQMFITIISKNNLKF